MTAYVHFSEMRPGDVVKLYGEEGDLYFAPFQVHQTSTGVTVTGYEVKNGKLKIDEKIKFEIPLPIGLKMPFSQYIRQEFGIERVVISDSLRTDLVGEMRAASRSQEYPRLSYAERYSSGLQ